LIDEPSRREQIERHHGLNDITAHDEHTRSVGGGNTRRPSRPATKSLFHKVYSIMSDGVKSLQKKTCQPPANSG
jgi:hypothetical protein